MTYSWPLRLSVWGGRVIRITAGSPEKKEDLFGASVFLLMPSPGQTRALWFIVFGCHENTKWLVFDACVWKVEEEEEKKGSYFALLGIQEWFIFQMKTDWRHKHRQAHGTWMLLNGLVLAGWCEAGVIRRSAVVMWCAELCCAVTGQPLYANGLRDTTLL